MAMSSNAKVYSVLANLACSDFGDSKSVFSKYQTLEESPQAGSPPIPNVKGVWPTPFNTPVQPPAAYSVPRTVGLNISLRLCVYSILVILHTLAFGTVLCHERQR